MKSIFFTSSMLSYIIMIFHVLVTPLPSSNVLITMGDSLFAYGNYQEAITEYKRFIAFHPHGETHGQVLHKIGISYQKNEQWEASINFFIKSIEISNDEDFRNLNRISIGVSAIANGSYELALYQLNKAIIFSKNNKLRLDASFFRIIANIYLERWDGVRKSFEQFLALSTLQTNFLTEKFDSLLIEIETAPFKSPKKAEFLSLLLPGAGQLYTGAFKSALNAGILNAINFGFLYHLMKKEAFTDAGLFFLFVVIRYYKGNVYHAVHQSKNYNLKVIKELKYECFKVLSELNKNF